MRLIHFSHSLYIFLSISEAKKSLGSRGGDTSNSSRGGALVQGTWRNGLEYAGMRHPFFSNRSRCGKSESIDGIPWYTQFKMARVVCGWTWDWNHSLEMGGWHNGFCDLLLWRLGTPSRSKDVQCLKHLELCSWKLDSRPLDNWRQDGNWSRYGYGLDF